MLTLNSILEEIKDVPVNRLEELHQFIHSLVPQSKSSKDLKTKIMEFGGLLSDMSAEDYTDFLNHTKKVRTDLFNRDIEI